MARQEAYGASLVLSTCGRTNIGRTPELAERWFRKHSRTGVSLWVANWGSQMEEEPAKELEKLKIGECHCKRLHDGDSDGQWHPASKSSRKPSQQRYEDGQ